MISSILKDFLAWHVANADSNKQYRIEQNFGGEKTLVNLANRHNSPSFFAKIPDEARKCRQALDSPKFFPPIFQNHNFAKFFYHQSFVLYGRSRDFNKGEHDAGYN